MSKTYPSGNKDVQPPIFAQRLLQVLIDSADQNAILGDFAEIFSGLVEKHGQRYAKRWYWLAVFRSVPFLLVLRKQQWFRRSIMEKLAFFEKSGRIATIGILLLLPALLLAVGGLLFSLFGVAAINDMIGGDLFLFHPIVILGGMAIALSVNLLSVLRFQWQEGNLVSVIRVRGKMVNLGLIVLIGTLAALIFVYLLAENFQIFA